MARRRFIVWNGATAALTAAMPLVATGTAIKTMLQIKPTTPIALIEWGYQTDVVPTARVNTELLTTGTVGATVTNYAAGDIAKYDDAAGAASAIATGGGNTSGYTATAEGTIISTRLLAYRPDWGQGLFQQFPLDREPGVQANDFLRIRVTTTVSINMACYVIWEE
jgi:hypothetical protein